MIADFASLPRFVRSMAPNPPASSSTTVWIDNRPCREIPAFFNARAAAMQQATPTLHSRPRPRPQMRPSSTSPLKGSRFQADASPTGNNINMAAQDQAVVLVTLPVADNIRAVGKHIPAFRRKPQIIEARLKQILNIGLPVEPLFLLELGIDRWKSEPARGSG